MECSQCIKCNNFGMFRECKAFPKGIPEDIWTGLFDHKNPHEGDHGIQFEPLFLDEETSE